MIYSKQELVAAIATVLPNLNYSEYGNINIVLNMAAIEIFMLIEPKKEWLGCEYIIKVALWELRDFNKLTYNVK